MIYHITTYHTIMYHIIIYHTIIYHIILHHIELSSLSGAPSCTELFAGRSGFLAKEMGVSVNFGVRVAFALTKRVLLSGLYIRAPDFWKKPNTRDHRIPRFQILGVCCNVAFGYSGTPCIAQAASLRFDVSPTAELS